MSEEMGLGDVYELLGNGDPDGSITATTPHGSYVFNVAAVTVYDNGSVMLHLEERK